MSDTFKCVFFLIWTLVPVIIFFTIYRSENKKIVNFLVRMAGYPKMRKFWCYVLLLCLASFQILFFSLFPNESGILLSTALLIYFFSTKRTENLLAKLSSERNWFIGAVLAAIVTGFIPHLLPLSICIEFVVAFASCYPRQGADDFWQNHYYSDKHVQQFVNYYFSFNS